MFATYHIVRIVIVVIPLLIIMVLLIKRSKKRPSIFVVAGLILLILALGEMSSFIQFENLIVRFNTPEQVFKYAKGGEVLTILEGKDSALILYKYNESYSVWLPYKESERWRIPQHFSSGEVYNSYLWIASDNLYSINIQHLRNTDDYYVIIQGRNADGPVDVSDSRNSGFRYIQYGLYSEADLSNMGLFDSSAQTEQHDLKSPTYIYLSYLHGFEEEYVLFIEGEPVHIGNLQPIKGQLG